MYYQQLGLGWPKIASHLPGRVAEQVRDRFVNQIDPARQTTSWTVEEDKLLTELQSKHGNKWTYISKLMPGRSENAIKNRWYNRKTQQRRAMRRMFAKNNSANSKPAQVASKRRSSTSNVRRSSAAMASDNQEICTVKVGDIYQDDAEFCTDHVQDTDHDVAELCNVKVEDIDFGVMGV